MILNRTNVTEQITEYLRIVRAIEFRSTPTDILLLMNSLKRDSLGTGPYPKVSLFEASNRILSDLVILFGIRKLLLNTSVGDIKLPFNEYKVRLGTEGGNDIEANEGNLRLLGEAFSVASTFFQTKKSSSVKKLQSVHADYRLVVFNADSVNSPNYYLRISKPSLIYLPVDIWSEQELIGDQANR